MITAKEILMGRDKRYPLTKEDSYNLFDLLPRVNYVRFCYGKPLIVSSGYRPALYNAHAGGSKNSAHEILKAVDFKDDYESAPFAKWCLQNEPVLIHAGLFIEDPRWTPGWVHLQSRPTSKRVFIPYDPEKVPPKRRALL